MDNLDQIQGTNSKRLSLWIVPLLITLLQGKVITQQVFPIMQGTNVIELVWWWHNNFKHEAFSLPPFVTNGKKPELLPSKIAKIVYWFNNHFRCLTAPKSWEQLSQKKKWKQHILKLWCLKDKGRQVPGDTVVTHLLILKEIWPSFYNCLEGPTRLGYVERPHKTNKKFPLAFCRLEWRRIHQISLKNFFPIGNDIINVMWWDDDDIEDNFFQIYYQILLSYNDEKVYSNDYENM